MVKKKNKLSSREIACRLQTSQRASSPFGVVARSHAWAKREGEARARGLIARLRVLLRLASRNGGLASMLATSLPRSRFCRVTQRSSPTNRRLLGRSVAWRHKNGCGGDQLAKNKPKNQSQLEENNACKGSHMHVKGRANCSWFSHWNGNSVYKSNLIR